MAAAQSMTQIAAWIVASVLALAAALIAVGAALGLRPDIPRSDVVRRYTMPDSRFLTLPDGTIAHVRITGEGPSLVLLHGFSSSAWAWDGWTRELSGAYRVIRIDAPGHGLTKMAENADLSPDGGIAFLTHVLDALGEDRIALGGNSMGGAQAWRFAALHPERVSALILVDSAGPQSRRVERDIGQVRRAAANPLLRTLLLYGGGRFVMAQGLRSGVADPASITDEKIRRTDDLYRAEGNRRTLLRLLEQRSVSAPVDPATITAPTLILQGEQDTLVPPEVARALAATIPGARLILYPGLGHTPHEEDPAKTAADVRAFLTENVGGRTAERHAAQAPKAPKDR
ncbi:MAG: alpha/beta hydrolase [Alphaproteobacteria bacterium]|nr:alpha/beta hydrolase [Alphaproteobacteria bacterium]